MRILDQRSFRRGGVNPLTLVAVAAVASILFGVIFWGNIWTKIFLTKEVAVVEQLNIL